MYETTGYTDKNGVIINDGATVLHPDGWTGTVKFRFGAWRFDLDDKGIFLKKNSSLLYCDNWTPKDFKVINDNLPQSYTEQ